MFLNNIKARILKYCDLSNADLIWIKRWMKQSASFSKFDMDAFTSPSLQFATATTEGGEPLAYCPIERVFMVSAYAVSPTITPSQAQKVGDILDAAMAHAAQREGVSKFLLIVPKDHPALPEEEFSEVRMYVRKIPQSVLNGGVAYQATSAAKCFN